MQISTKMKSKILVALGLLMLVLTSCIDKEKYFPPTKPLKPISEYFDFNTTSTIEASLNYGYLASGGLLQVYDRNPMIVDEYGALVRDEELEPLYSIHLDMRGKYEGTMTLPAACDELFVYINSYAAPMLMDLKVVDGEVVTNTTVLPRQTARTRAAEDKQVYPLAGKANFYTLFSGYDDWGKVADFDTNGLLGEGDLLPEFYTALQTFLWGGTTKISGKMNNAQYAKGADIVNTQLLSEAVNPATGEMENIESAEVFFTFVGEAAWFENAIGYYYYKTGEAPAKPDALKKFVILPNTSIAYHAPYGVKANILIEADKAPASVNTRVQLLYMDDEGNVSTSFPPGYTIGYFIIPAAMGTGTYHYTNIQFNQALLYSDEKWNANSTKRYIALESKDGSLVYGVEDSSDGSYDDVLFTISASPNFSMKKAPEIPVLDVDAKQYYSTETRTRTYAYEDQWPTGGDYDLNDVIVEHVRTITFNSANYVSEVIDEFTPVQPARSATYADAFAVQYMPAVKGDLTLPEGATWEEDTHSAILFTDAKSMVGKTFTVKRTFNHSLNSGIKKQDLDNEVYNPYIIAQYDEVGGMGRTEVHLPKAQATSYADTEQIGSADDAYYLNKDGKHPFAIEIPMLRWAPVTECVTIGDEYLRFNAWVESFGKTNKDWYLKK